LGDVLISGEKLDFHWLVKEPSLVQQVEADEGAGEFFKLDEGLTESGLFYGGRFLQVVEGRENEGDYLTELFQLA